jgi:hypothetical protein
MKAKRFAYYSPVWILLILGMGLVVYQPLGLHLTNLPGDLGDTRFNIYILEHFYHWVTGQLKDYWNAPFFYPFQQTIAFSDNLLGSAPSYVLFRWLGLDRETSFQGWYILGYLLNFAAASYVLIRINLRPLAAGAGAFFFTFGLPVLAQENHVQLLYRFCIPMACLMLWQFYQIPRLQTLVYLCFWIVWQFFLTIYMGFFLVILIGLLFLLTPLFIPEPSPIQRITAWPHRFKEAWFQTHPRFRLITMFSLAGILLCFIALILPYYRVHKAYGFYRNWSEVSEMLPRWQSYLLSDNSKFWRSQSTIFSDLPLRHEHQLFPGVAVLIMILIGAVGRFKTENRRLAWLNLCAGVIFIFITLDLNGFSLYKFFWHVPGMNSVRAVTRSMLVVIWPLSLFASWSIDGVIRWSKQQSRWWQPTEYFLVGLLVLESIFYSHTTFTKAVDLARLEKLHQLIPTEIPSNPILFVAADPQEPFWANEIDAMLLAQELGWPTLNGYSGNNPPGYKSAESCAQLPARILNYMDFEGINDPIYYLETMKRVVPLGFNDCDPSWWEQMP